MRNIIFAIILMLLGGLVLFGALLRGHVGAEFIGLFVGIMAGAAFHLFTGIRKLQAAKRDQILTVEPVDDHGKSTQS